MASLNAKRVHFSPGAEAALGEVLMEENAAEELGEEENVSATEFEHYMKLHGKSKMTYCQRRYEDDVKGCKAAFSRAEANFRKNSEVVAQHNRDSQNTYKLRVNKYADVDMDEFVASTFNYRGRMVPRNHFRHQTATRLAREFQISIMLGAADESLTFPAKFNWRDHANVIGQVHNQKQDCASCWAFVSSDILESLMVIRNETQTHQELAVDELINCDTFDNGCATGNMFTAFEWIETQGGLSLKDDFNEEIGDILASPEKDFHNTFMEENMGTSYALRPEPHFEMLSPTEVQMPLEALQERVCSAVHGSHNRKSPVYGYCELSLAGGEKELMEALMKSPIAIGLNANRKFQLYDSGILQMKDCPPAAHSADSMYTAINHAALLTGWGEETMDNGQVIKYWVVKNSFGADWGEDGYFRLERGPLTPDGMGTCGMYFESVYPVVDRAKGTARECIRGATFRDDYYRALMASQAQQGAAMSDLFNTNAPHSAARSAYSLSFLVATSAGMVAMISRTFRNWRNRPSSSRERQRLIQEHQADLV
jgi:C1A family cysteine protease